MSSPAEPVERVTEPVRLRAAMSRPACNAAVVTDVPSARMSWPAVTEARVTEPPVVLAVWKRASVAAVAAPDIAMDPPSDLTSMSEPERLKLLFSTDGSAPSRISPAWPLAELSEPVVTRVPLTPMFPDARSTRSSPAWAEARLMAPPLARTPMSRAATRAPVAVTSPEPDVEPSISRSSSAVRPTTLIAPAACSLTSEPGPFALAWPVKPMVPPETTSMSLPVRAKLVPDTVIGPFSLGSMRPSATP